MNPLTPYLHKFVKLFGKLLIRAQKERPLQFTPLLPQSVEFCYNQLKQSAMALDNITKEKEMFLVHCMIFIKNVVETEDYREGTQVLVSFSTNTLYHTISHDHTVVLLFMWSILI